MDFIYKVCGEEGNIENQRVEMHKSEKLKDPVKITVEVTMERAKYYQRLKRYKSPIGSKILDLFDWLTTQQKSDPLQDSGEGQIVLSDWKGRRADG